MAKIIKADGTAAASRGAVMGLAGLAAEAQTLVLEARQEAARIVAEARAEADAACESAAEKAYAEGFARGRCDGHADGRQQGLEQAKEAFAARAEGLVELAGRIVRELADARAELLRCGRSELLDFALTVARKVVGEVAAHDPAAASENLRKALELSDSAREVCVKVHPSQLEALCECLPALSESLGRGGAVRLVGDAGVSPGGAKLFSASGEIDATIETQMANIAEALLGPHPGPGAGEWYRGDRGPRGEDGAPAGEGRKHPVQLTGGTWRRGAAGGSPDAADETSDAATEAGKA